MIYTRTLSLWAAMTAVMMTPVVAPWLRAVYRLERTGPVGGGATRTEAWFSPVPVTLGFAAGYVGAWSGFAAAAAALQVSLGAIGVPMPLGSLGGIAAGVPLILVGAYQFTGIKDRCLSKCRSPMGYLLSHWRAGSRGGLEMGFGHGLHCLGCCWALMLLALVVGHMHLAWMAVLTAVMIIETVMPGGRRAVRPVGALLVLVGLASALGWSPQ
ncbi:MAG: DUF2182 domain-containing protein [Gemmatimonadetes bacterium]|nr:DUF2182 domain-containing protein [Gemmatimonadota bacterium]